MAFPSSGGTVASLADAWAQARSIAASIKNQAQGVRNASVAGPIGSSQILRMSVFLAEMRAQLELVRLTPGLGAYVQEQLNNPAINIATEFTNMLTTVDNTIAWIVANFPQSGGFLAAQTIVASGMIADRQFSTASLVNFRTVLDTLIATID